MVINKRRPLILKKQARLILKKQAPLISAIVTNYNGWSLGLLPEFLNHFLSLKYPDIELFVVDNASTDDSANMVEEKYSQDKRVKVIRNPLNVMSAGINMALRKIKGDYIVFLNNDLFFDDSFFNEFIKLMEKDSSLALVQGKMVSFFNHKKIDSVGETMDIYGNPVTIGAGEEDHGQYDKPMEALSVGGAASMLRTSVLDEVGLLDPHYGIGYEDMDLALRVRLAGYKIIYWPKVIVYHKRASSTSIAPEDIRVKIKFDFNKNRLTTMIKNYELKTLAEALPVTLSIYLFAGIVEIFYKRLFRFGISRFTSIFWCLVNLPYILKERDRIQNKVRKLPDSVAILPFMAKGRVGRGFFDFLRSKRW